MQRLKCTQGEAGSRMAEKGAVSTGWVKLFFLLYRKSDRRVKERIFRH